MKKETNQFFTDEDFVNISSNVFSNEQLIELRKPTPESVIQIKEDSDGYKYKTVTGQYMKKRLNIIFSFNTDFLIMDKEYHPASSEVVVHGRLIIRTGKVTITKEQFGKHLLTSKTTTQGNQKRTFASDIGNAYKSAATDAFKKCASEIGLCWDIYSQEKPESEEAILTEETHAEKKITERLEHFLKSSKTEKAIDKVVHNFKENEEMNEERDLLVKLYKSKIK
jgi:hypothetical protein